jgi:hypothetical protein
LKKIVEVGVWVIEVDVEATRQVYEKNECAFPARCDCCGCRNFQILSENAFPASFRAWLSELGIDYRKAAELIDDRSPTSETHRAYWGWFHCVGNILSGPDHAWKFKDGMYIPGQAQQWHAWENGFEISISSGLDVPFEEFGDNLLVQIEFSAVALPWALDEEMPE